MNWDLQRNQCECLGELVGILKKPGKGSVERQDSISF